MRTSVSMYSLDAYVKQHYWDVFDFIRFAKSIGCDGVELLDMYWCDAADVTRVLAALERENLPVSAYDTSNDFVHRDSDARRSQVHKVKRDIDIAYVLGTNIVRIFCGDAKEGVSQEEGLSWIIACMKECAEYAEMRGITLAIENHGLFAGNSKQVKEIIESVGSSYVGSTFDTGNFLLVGESPEAALSVLKEEVKHVHFKDFQRVSPSYQGPSFQGADGSRVAGIVAGDGEVNLHHIVQVLRSIGYDGWYSIEYEGQHDAKESVEQSVNNLLALV
ncbi:sugar phosphate isomerase/epimerase family protein [Pontibacillus salicampi]|uniref:Sugar phosphate isomerase/epimerase family protein n=1 Tax=Pontibacillus salicampi TaxID=1449801 RepID=A0ABV6LSX0_9BACI